MFGLPLKLLKLLANNMELLSKLPKTTTKSAKRRGRGIGSGRGGHTTGSGAKGDNVRGKGKLTFDGTKIKKSWLKRLPFLRGKHRLLPRLSVYPITLTQLDNWFKADDTVTPQKIFEKVTHLKHSDLNKKVKVLATGKLTKKLIFKNIAFSTAAAKKVEAAGAKIES